MELAYFESKAKERSWTTKKRIVLLFYFFPIASVVFGAVQNPFPPTNAVQRGTENVVLSCLSNISSLAIIWSLLPADGSTIKAIATGAFVYEPDNYNVLQSGNGVSTLIIKRATESMAGAYTCSENAGGSATSQLIVHGSISQTVGRDPKVNCKALPNEPLGKSTAKIAICIVLGFVLLYCKRKRRADMILSNTAGNSGLYQDPARDNVQAGFNFSSVDRQPVRDKILSNTAGNSGLYQNPAKDNVRAGFNFSGVGRQLVRGLILPNTAGNLGLYQNPAKDNARAGFNFSDVDRQLVRESIKLLQQSDELGELSRRELDSGNIIAASEHCKDAESLLKKTDKHRHLDVNLDAHFLQSCHYLEKIRQDINAAMLLIKRIKITLSSRQ